MNNWGKAIQGGHVQLIACRTSEELELIKRDLYNDNTMSYVDWNCIDNYNNIYNWTRGKTFTIRNDWTRAFTTEEQKNAYMNGVTL